MDWVPCSRQATFAATVLSTVSVIVVILGLPMMHMHIQKLTSAMLSEVELCRVRSWIDFLTFGAFKFNSLEHLCLHYVRTIPSTKLFRQIWPLLTDICLQAVDFRVSPEIFGSKCRSPSLEIFARSVSPHTATTVPYRPDRAAPAPKDSLDLEAQLGIQDNLVGTFNVHTVALKLLMLRFYKC